MSDSVRQERCAEVASALMVLIPAIIGGKADPEQLAEGLPAIARVRAVVDAGSDGIEHPGYLAWLRGAAANVRAIEEAIEAGDADAAFAALRDADSGLHLLSSGCEGCAGW